MKIWYLLVIGMFGIFLTFGIIGIVSFDLSIQEMKKFLGSRNESFSFNMMQGLDEFIEKRLDDFKELTNLQILQNVVKKSNEEFRNLYDIEEFIQEMEENIEYPDTDTPPFIDDTLYEDLSEELGGTIQFYKGEYGYDVIQELFVTNEFGANVALGSGISDNSYAEEQWWQIAKNDGIYTGDLEFREIYAGNSMDFGFRIIDENENFIGVLRVLLSLDDLLHEFIEESDLVTTQNRNVALLDNDGRIIFSNEIQNFSTSKPLPFFDQIQQGKNVGTIELPQGDDDVRIISYAKSTGYRTFEGFGWITIVEQNDSSIVDEFIDLRNSILIVSVIGMLASVVIGLVISVYISKPLKRLSSLAISVSKGNFDREVKKSRISEIDVIGKSFNKMSHSLKKLIETEKQLAEAHVRIKNERLTAIGELASSLAHDLKNPLAIIRTSIDIIKRDLKGHSEEIDKVLARTDRAMSRMSHQIEDVLNFVRITPLNETTVSIHSLLRSALDSSETAPNLTVDLQESSVQIKCDARKMEIVFINLLHNAKQAIGYGDGQISIRIKDEDDFVIIDIQDTGEGIPDEIISKIFDPLVTTKEKGTGLGLSTCKNIIEQHGGKITVSTNPTIFTVKLPKKE